LYVINDGARKGSSQSVPRKKNVTSFFSRYGESPHWIRMSAFPSRETILK
jgi:hypothetical protein